MVIDKSINQYLHVSTTIHIENGMKTRTLEEKRDILGAFVEIIIGVLLLQNSR